MIGVPMTAGYASKHYLTDGADAIDAPWAGWVLLASSVLNAAYFLPILFRAWFMRQSGPWPEERIMRRGWRETTALLLFPPLISAATVIGAGVLADHDWSPLSWAKLIANRQYLGLES
jgi:multicomponent Na+:H+ antiporter subunit D